MVTKAIYPQAPSLYTVRLATLQDVPRIGFVAVAGFRHTQIFEFERPYYEKYPQDAWHSLCELFRGAIMDSNSVVIVVEDEYDEKNHIPSAPEEKPGQRVIVGVAAWTYEPDSPRKGQFENPQDPWNATEHSMSGRRDEIADRTRRVDAMIEAAKKKYFPTCNHLAKLVIHLAYWRRGHGTALLSWGKRLADMDGVNQGTLPSRIGEKIAVAEGFERIGSIHVDGDELDPKGIDMAVGLYTSKRRNQVASS